MNVAASRTGKALLGSYFVVLAVFLYIPLVVLVVFAFNDSQIQTLPYSGFTTRWFSDAFANRDLIAAVQRSAVIGIICAVGATLLGLITAVGLTAKKMALRGLVTALVLLPLVIPYVVLAVGLLILLNSIGVNRALWAVLLGHVAVSVPYSLLIILPRLRALDESIVEAARDLGAGAFTAFRRITLPLIVPALFSSALIAFTISFDEFAIASFLIPPGHDTYPVFVYTGARTPALEPQIIAVGAMIVVASLIIVTGSEVLRTRAERKLDA
ncbi:MAG: ABC transporter permease [Actinomycetota bacterium]|nr:ABC transporter permease [Actinomycetota bacterium]